jgi:hypothetical protein
MPVADGPPEVLAVKSSVNRLWVFVAVRVPPAWKFLHTGTPLSSRFSRSEARAGAIFLQFSSNKRAARALLSLEGADRPGTGELAVDTDDSNKADWIREVLSQREGPLIRYAAQITGDLDRARDVVQDTFLRLCAEDRSRLDGHQLLNLKLRYKAPDGATSQLIETPVRDSGLTYTQASRDFKFAAAVAGFGMVLRDSPYEGSANLDAVIELAEEGKGRDPNGYRAEFIGLVKEAKRLSR